MYHSIAKFTPESNPFGPLQTARRRSGAAGTAKANERQFWTASQHLVYFSCYPLGQGKKAYRFCSPTEIFPEFLLSVSSVSNRYVIHSLSKTAQKIKRTPTELLAAHQEAITSQCFFSTLEDTKVVDHSLLTRDFRVTINQKCLGRSTGRRNA